MATAAWLAAVSSNVPEAAAARSVNSETASFWRSWARDSAAPGAGSASGGTGTTYSPGTESGSRLVAITRRPGAALIRSATSPAGRAGQVLAVVHDQQQVGVPQVVAEQGQRPGRGLVAQVEGRHDGVADQAGIGHLGQLDQPAAIAEAAGEIRGRPAGQPGLAHAARSDQADQARLGEFLPDLGQLATAADEAGRLGRKVARAAGGPRHKGRLYGAAARIRYPLGNSADAGPAGAFLA